MVLSHGLWQRRFGSDPKVVGTSINMDGNLYAIRVRDLGSKINVNNVHPNLVRILTNLFTAARLADAAASCDILVHEFYSQKGWETVVRTNLTGGFLGAHLAVRRGDTVALTYFAPAAGATPFSAQADLLTRLSNGRSGLSRHQELPAYLQAAP